MEPLAENVDGKKIQKVTHSVEHSIDWGHVAIGAAGLAAAWVAYRLFVSQAEEQSAGALNGGVTPD